MHKLKIDLHVHSKYSKDSFTPINKIIKYADKIGLDGVAITDHDTIKGALEARKLKKYNIYVIIGSEITLTNGGEILGLFLNEEIKNGTFFEVYDQIQDQDGVILLPHPFRNSKNNFQKLNSEEMSKIKIIEVINAFNYPSENEKAIKMAKKYSLAMTAGSDSHHFSTIGKAYTIFHADINDLRRELKRGNIDIYGESISKKDRRRTFYNRELKSKHYKKIIQYYYRYLFEGKT